MFRTALAANSLAHAFVLGGGAANEDYPIEAHVPDDDLRRLLEERPDAVGLTVPGMPLGSPGMDFGDDRAAYEVLLVREHGSSEVFSSYPAD